MKPLTSLPKGIQKKIRFAPEDADEATACWEWTGTTIKARRRYKPYRIPDHQEGNWNFVGCYNNERETPMVHSPEIKHAIAAHRHLKAICEEVPVRSLPRLSRCSNPRCVSPYHTLMTEQEVPKSAYGRTRGGLPVMDYMPPSAEAPTAATATVELLRAREVAPFFEREDAEREVGMPIRPEIWSAYCAECEAEDDND